MVRFVLRVLGVPVLSLDTIHYELVGDDDDTERIEGGSAHNFERDVNPLSPDDRYGWEYEDRSFGFGGPRA
jgi:hypothetical protein